MKKLVILCSALFVCFFTAQAQQSGLPATGENAALEQTEDTPLFKTRKKTTFLDTPDKLDVDLQIGTSVGTTFGNGTFFSNYAAPSLRYNLHPRWNMRVGTMFVNNQFTVPAMGGSEGGGVSRINNFQSFVYTQGQYLASDRLRLTGTAFYELNQFGGPGLRMNPQATNFTSKGASIYAEYKISEHFSVGAGAQISNGNNFLRNGLYGQPGFYGPGMPFNSMGRW